MGQNPFFREHTPEEWGQLHMEVIFQDTDGWMWFGAGEKVFRYDGISYEHFVVTDTSAATGAVRSIASFDQKIWIGFESGQIATIRPGAAHKMALKTNGDIRSVHTGEMALWTPEEGTPTAPITGFAAGKDSSFWISTYGEGLYVVSQGRMYQFSAADDGISGDEIYAVVADNAGNIWAATDAGISICSMTKEGTKSVKNLTTADGLPDEVVMHLSKSCTGDISFSTNNGGVRW